MIISYLYYLYARGSYIYIGNIFSVCGMIWKQSPCLDLFVEDSESLLASISDDALNTC